MATQPASSSVASSPPITSEGQRRLRRGLGGNSRQRGDTIAAYLFLAPYLIVLGVFFIFVSLYGVGLSFFKVDIGFTTPEFIGLRNYQFLFNQLSNVRLSDFWTSMLNIIEFTIFVVIGQTILAMILALILQAVVVGKGVFRTIFYILALTSSVATSLIFLWLYNPDGLFNYLLSFAHLQGKDWLNDTTFALPAIMLLNIWTTGAAFMIYFLTALQDLPKELLEAAAVDGANRLQAFWNVTIPLLRPAIFFVVAIGTIGAFQMFDQAKFMTNGGPDNATLTPMLEIYNTAFGDNRFGLAAAISVLLFIVIFIVTLIQRRLIDPGTQQL